MTIIAVTGHIDLADSTIPLVRAALENLLKKFAGNSEIIGISCIAKGADSIFAEAVLAAGGRLRVVIPSQDYRQKIVKDDHAPLFDRLVNAAEQVNVLPYKIANSQAYSAANAILLEQADRLVAVWNGEAPTGKGGTAGTVFEAQKAGIPVDVIWPVGAARTG